jgi:prophage tail gpP-like protein
MADPAREEITVYSRKKAFIGNAHPIVTLKVGGKLHSGWKQVDIRRSIETIAGGFQLVMSDYDPAQRKIVTIAPGEACELAVDGQTIITGYVDDSAFEFDADKHEVTIVGRDRTGDLVDGMAYIPAHQPGTWNNGVKVLQIISEIAQPYSIGVTEEVDSGTATFFALQPGEKAFTAIDRICKEAAVLPVSDGLGALVLTRGGLGGSFSDLVQGKNIVAGRGYVSHRDRYSDYYVFSEAAGEFVAEAGDAHQGIAKDPGVTRWRPLFIIADFKKPTAEALAARANWEMTVHAGRALRHIVVTQGWKDDKGTLWQPNGMVRVTSSKLGCDETLLIVATRHVEDEQGTRTELTLTRPDAFKLTPLEDQVDIVNPAPSAGK